MIRVFFLLVLGLAALWAANEVSRGDVEPEGWAFATTPAHGKVFDPAVVEKGLLWVNQKYRAGQHINCNRVITLTLTGLGGAAMLLGFIRVAKRGGGRLRTGAAGVLLWWGKNDPFTVRDLLNGGVLIAGRSGSGKTSASGRAIGEAVVKLRGSGGLILGATQSDRAMWEGIFRQCGRSRDFLVFGPDVALRFNAMDYVLQSGGSPRDITRLLMVAGETLRTSDQKGGEAGDFWEGEKSRGIYNAVVPVKLALGKVTAADLQKFIATAAQNPAQVKETEWSEQSFHAQIMRKAYAVQKSALEATDFKVACEYWMGEFPAMDPRTRGNITTTIFSTLHVMCSGYVNELLSTTTNITPEDLVAGRWVFVDMSPNEYGDMGLCVSSIWKYLVQKAILKRRADDKSNVVVVWADEAHQFVTSFDNPFLAMCRARKGCMVYLVQSINAFYVTLKGESGKAKTHALCANFGTKVFHSLGDTETAKFATDLLGQQMTTFVGGSTQPHADVYDELYGATKFSGNFNERYSEVLQTQVFMSGMRTGGSECGFVCDSVVIKSGVPFSSGQAWIWVTWRQR